MQIQAKNYEIEFTIVEDNGRTWLNLLKGKSTAYWQSLFIQLPMPVFYLPAKIIRHADRPTRLSYDSFSSLDSSQRHDPITI